MTIRALVLIDLQNEFLSPQGHFPIHESSRTILETIPTFVHAFRDTGGPVFWIRSEYSRHHDHPTPVSDTDDNFLTGTHSGQKLCCEPNSYGAAFLESIHALIAESSQSENIIITKTWYSAFKETTLLADLKSRGVTELFVGGLITNVCVKATVTDARNLGFSVSLVEDCLGWRKYASHEKALDSMRELGVQVLSGDTVFAPDASVPQPLVPKLYYVNGSIPSWRVMMTLYEKNVQFEAIRLKVMSTPKETRLPAFLALNHRGKTPVFVDMLSPATTSAVPVARPTTININESLAILQYIETYHKTEKPLLPPTSERAARALVMSRIQETENLHNLYDALEDAHFHGANSGGTLGDTERTELTRAIHHELDFWEVYAKEAVFIAGNEFGLADCAFFPLLAYMVHRGFTWTRNSESAARGDAWPYLKVYYERVWVRGGTNGCAQRAQPEGWNRPGKANVWRVRKTAVA